MTHPLHPASRRQCRMNLLLAHGLAAGDWTKIAVIDSERGSAHLYADLGAYYVLPLTALFTPKRYLDALAICEQAGMQVIILDSITHCWEYLLDYHASLPGNSFTAWSKVTPRHNAFVDRLLRSTAYIIATVRSKMEYALSEKNGKQVPEKLGMKSIQRDSLDYKFSLVFEHDSKLHAVATKDRTRLFAEQPPFWLGEGTGQALLRRCSNGSPATPPDEQGVRQAIRQVRTLDELVTLYYRIAPEHQASLRAEFLEQKQHLQSLLQAPSNLGADYLYPQSNTHYGNLAHSA